MRSFGLGLPLVRSVPLLVLVACGQEAAQSDVKMVGVGLDPDQVGATGEPAGGLFEYDWIDFAGDQLPLALLGFSIFDPADYALGFKPPYAMVTGNSFFFDEDVNGPASLYGSVAAAPGAPGSCQMVVRPFSYLSSVADVGDRLTLTGPDDIAVSMDRYPAVYPTDPQDVFPYYTYVASWRDAPSYTYVRTDPKAQSPYDLERQVLEAPNFQHGVSMELSFPGAIPPIETNASSIPVPLASTGPLPTIDLPDRPAGIRMSWDGPRYDRYGTVLSEGEQSTCLQYRTPLQTPSTPEQCAVLEDPTVKDNELTANMYTGPWDTDEGVRFEWAPIPGSDDSVTITVRFLGPVNIEEFLLDPYVAVSPSDDAQAAWANAKGSVIPSDAELETGYRTALPCDDPDDVEWIVNPALQTTDGYTPVLQGNPLDTLLEFTCQVADEDGQFVLTEELLQPALDYADLHGAEGTVFYFNRSRQGTFQAPPVRDRYGKGHDTSDIQYVTNSIELGRFWYGR